jgi:hypothetical protein
MSLLGLLGCYQGQAGSSMPTGAVVSASEPATMPAASQPIARLPEPISLLLPKQIRIHPFTGTRVFSEDGGISGVDVRIEAIDGFGDATKAFGKFRFELYRFAPSRPDGRGDRLASWPADVDSPAANKRHWNGITRTYQFKLAWSEPVPIGKKFVLQAAFDSPYTGRLFDQRIFISGQ